MSGHPVAKSAGLRRRYRQTRRSVRKGVHIPQIPRRLWGFEFKCRTHRRAPVASPCHQGSHCTFQEVRPAVMWSEHPSLRGCCLSAKPTWIDVCHCHKAHQSRPHRRQPIAVRSAKAAFHRDQGPVRLLGLRARFHRGFGPGRVRGPPPDQRLPQGGPRSAFQQQSGLLAR